MPIIKPISDLKNKTSETYRIAKDSDEPIFLTKNGEGHLVLMSMEYYNKKESQSFFEGKLLEAENAHIDDEGIPLESVFSDIRARLKK